MSTAHDSSHHTKAIFTTMLVLGLLLFAAAASAAVVWKARHGGDQAVNIGHIPMPYHQAFTR